MKPSWLLIATILLVLEGCRQADPEGTLFVSGRIDGDTVDISSKIAGRITEITVREGDSVQAGQTLVVLTSPQDEARRDQQQARVVAGQRRLDQLQRQLKTYDERVRQAHLYEQQANQDAPARVQEAEANLAASKAELVRWQAELKQRQVDAERYEPLAQSGAVAKQLAEDYDTRVQVAQASVDAGQKDVAAAEASLQAAKAQLENPRIKESDRLTLMHQAEELKAEIAAARAEVEAAKAELRRIEADLNDLTLLAPIAGTILTRVAEPGRVIAAGQTVLTMVDLNKLYLRGFIPEGEIGRVKVGQPAQVYLDSAPDDSVAAEVIRIDPQVMFTPENTYFRDDRVKQVMGVKLGLKGAFGFAKPGMPADGRIEIAEGLK